MLVGAPVGNTSGKVITIESVQAKLDQPGAEVVGWHLFRVPDRGMMLSVEAARDPEYARQLIDVTSAAKVLQPRSELPPNVVLYVTFVLHTHAAFRTDKLRISYRQGTSRHVQTFSVGYRLQTVGTQPAA